MHICSNCYRHVREPRCPFCLVETRNAVPVAGGAAMYVGMRRAAVLAGALAVTGCNSEVLAIDASYGIAVDAAPLAVDAGYGIAPGQDATPRDVANDAAITSDVPSADASPEDATAMDR